MTACEVNIVRLGDPPPFTTEGKFVHGLQLDRFVVLEGGTDKGNTSVAIITELPDGSIGIIQTTADIFESLAATLRGARQNFGEKT